MEEQHSVFHANEPGSVSGVTQVSEVGCWGSWRVLRAAGKFSNIWIAANGPSAVIVDAGVPSDGAAVADYLLREGVSARWVFLTHLHIDHVAGIGPLLEGTGASLAAGRPVRPFLEGRPVKQLSLGEWAHEVIPDWMMEGAHVPSRFDLRRAIWAGLPGLRTGFGSIVCHFARDGGGLAGVEGWEVMELPGHTADSAGLYHIEEGLLFAGDVVITLGGRPRFNGIVARPPDMDRTNARLHDLQLNAVFPGHGPPLIEPEASIQPE